MTLHATQCQHQSERKTDSRQRQKLCVSILAVAGIPRGLQLQNPYVLKCVFTAANTALRLQMCYLQRQFHLSGCTNRKQFCCDKISFTVTKLPQVFADYLVSWCFEPSQPQRITSRLNTNFTLSSKSFISQVIIPQVMFLSLFILRGHLTREPASGRVTSFILWAYSGTMC